LIRALPRPRHEPAVHAANDQPQSPPSLPTGPDVVRMNQHYDRVMYAPLLDEYFGHSDFQNYGCWDTNPPDRRAACERLMERLLALLPAGRGRVLDVACGKGASTRYLLRYYSPAQVVGVNVSPKQLATCRGNVPQVAFLQMDAARLGFGDATFDHLVCVEAAFHFDTRADFLREAHRVLRPGGRLVLTDVLLTCEAERRRLSFTEKNHLDGPAGYAALLRACGFAALEVSDATEDCWRASFRHFVQHVHELYLRHRIDRAALAQALDQAYSFVGDLEHYLIAAATRP